MKLRPNAVQMLRHSWLKHEQLNVKLNVDELKKFQAELKLRAMIRL